MARQVISAALLIVAFAVALAWLQVRTQDTPVTWEIGVVVPLTGPDAAEGAEHLRAVQLAVEARRGVLEGHVNRPRVEIVAYDSNAESSADPVEKWLAGAGDRLGLIGFHRNAELARFVGASEPLAGEPPPLIAVGATQVGLGMGGSGRASRVHRFVPQNGSIASAMVDAALRDASSCEAQDTKREMPKFAIVSDGTAYGDDLAEQLVNALMGKKDCRWVTPRRDIPGGLGGVGGGCWSDTPLPIDLRTMQTALFEQDTASAVSGKVGQFNPAHRAANCFADTAKEPGQRTLLVAASATATRGLLRAHRAADPGNVDGTLTFVLSPDGLAPGVLCDHELDPTEDPRTSALVSSTWPESFWQDDLRESQYFVQYRRAYHSPASGAGYWSYRAAGMLLDQELDGVGRIPTAKLPADPKLAVLAGVSEDYPYLTDGASPHVREWTSARCALCPLAVRGDRCR